MIGFYIFKAIQIFFLVFIYMSTGVFFAVGVGDLIIEEDSTEDNFAFFSIFTIFWPIVAVIIGIILGVLTIVSIFLTVIKMAAKFVKNIINRRRYDDEKNN